MAKLIDTLPMQEIAEKYVSGHSTLALGKMYNVSYETIRTKLTKFGIKLRTVGESLSLWQRGIPKSKSVRDKISKTLTGRVSTKSDAARAKQKTIKPMQGIVGPAHPGWRGGTIPLRRELTEWSVYKKWKQNVLERDGFICQECFSSSGVMHAHHIKPVKVILKDNNIKTAKEAINCADLWDVTNGQTLCSVCHPKVEKRINYKTKSAAALIIPCTEAT